MQPFTVTLQSHKRPMSKSAVKTDKIANAVQTNKRSYTLGRRLPSLTRAAAPPPSRTPQTASFHRCPHLRWQGTRSHTYTGWSPRMMPSPPVAVAP